MSVMLNKNVDDLSVNAIKFLAVDGIEKAKSGHPGLPMGVADIAYVLWTKFLRYNPEDPKWPNRDRFVLSGGHGSMLLYSLLHLSGYNISLDDLKNFRQWESNTPGHPEYEIEKGIETTTGPLGQGIANAVGMAMAQKRVAATFNRPDYNLIDHKIYTMLGDGDMMEGISHEACSLAGHLGLNNLIAIYDDNDISIEGSTNIAFTECVKGRFEAYGWFVQKIDGHDRAAIFEAFEKANTQTDKPSLIIAQTVIANGAPNKQGTAAAHGEPLGADEVKAAKEAAQWPLEPAFYVPSEVYDVFASHVKGNKAEYNAWQEMFAGYSEAFSDEADLWDKMMNKYIPANLDDKMLAAFDCNKPTATRASSGMVIQELAKHVPALWGGSADLSPSNKSDVKGGGSFSAQNPLGRNIHFGVREHGMGSALNGMSLYGGTIPYGATFFVFSDYLRPVIRIASLMKQQVIYVFTHDSIFVGEDGPTHEPIEHLAALRCIPGVTVIRPADTAETVVAWTAAMEKKDGPTALVLSRQNLCSVNADQAKAKNLRKGAYIVKDAEKIDVIIIGTGSEVGVALNAAEMLAQKGISARVVSMPSMELFDAQDQAYKESVLPASIRKRVAVEAASPFGWSKYIGLDGLMIGMNHFGASAPYEILAKEFGFTAESVAKEVEEYLK